ncbi:3-oxoadipate enol-lactonase [Marinovum sp. 2_MG-2023]|uniref:3-oxoadipate enol-lactonase n=1 Tax=unclassified Marinovum TaxID=2647166 RepID=UPI0026E484BF|nr:MULTISPECIES: 3-oxoadipate enol-lactonase [unclassified Marinovum]MDO6728579.1 3-oxoadipate enol-lactonase [Marinovum sp. 2_MG-2023]MDO6778005.1 3-oxoadipate enol-lactonase [Marinovum sp. 1_MG-2023]
MAFAEINGCGLHYREDGDPDGAALVFGNSLGCDLRIWDDVVAQLPPGLRILRYDMRGHGLSECPPGPYGMGTLVRDAEGLMDHLGLRDAVFVGLSLGGMVAQGLAVKRLDLVRGLVLACTAAKVGTAAQWQDRIATVQGDGIAALLDATMERWFTAGFRATPDIGQWRNMVARQPAEGYAACCAAISGTDFYTPTASLRLPCLGIAASEDRATPPDLVRETIALIPGARFELLRRAGHLACIEQPEAFGGLVNAFLRDIGHV